MKQVLVIHGGTSYSSYEAYLDDLKNSPLNYERMKKSPRWSEWLQSELLGVDVLTPSFPNSQNAQYEEWKILFEKILPYLTGDVILVGHSLGGMFLAKYLQENPLRRPVKSIVLVAPAYNDNSNEDLGSFGVESATRLGESTNEVHLFHSQDDPVVPFTELAKFQSDLPDAHVHIFSDRNHFLQPTFPELAAIIEAV